MIVVGPSRYPRPSPYTRACSLEASPDLLIEPAARSFFKLERSSCRGNPPHIQFLSTAEISFLEVEATQQTPTNMATLIIAVTLASAARAAVSLKPVDRLDAATVTLDRSSVAPLPTFAPLPVLADAPKLVLDDVPVLDNLPMRRAALREWADEGKCVEGLGDRIEIGEEGIVATAPAKKGDVIFAMSTESVVTAHAAYNDPDLLSLRPIAQQAGPGFGVVAMAALLAAEEVRGYRRRLMSSCAPESPSTVDPSEWGPALRPLWAADQLNVAAFIDPDVAPIVDQGCAIILPLLEAAARRSWSGPKPEKPELRTLPDHWRRIELYADGAAPSWSRGDLERVARKSFGLVLAAQRPPPNYVKNLFDGANVLADAGAPSAWVQRVGAGDDVSVVSKPLALVPLVSELVARGAPNTVLGAPPPQKAGNRGEGQALWCVAARDIKAGERLVAADPWAL